MVKFTVEASLTPRQLEVLRLMADGLTNAAIGRSVGLSASTVKHYRRQVLLLLQASSSAHAVHRAHVLGLLG